MSNAPASLKSSPAAPRQWRWVAGVALGISLLMLGRGNMMKVGWATDQDQQPGKASKAPIDPAYRELADKTGGKVYDMRNPADARAFREDFILKPRRQARIRHFREWFERAGPVLILIVYAALKFAAYTVWCFVGLGLRDAPPRRWKTAALWGLARLGIGVAFGLAIFLFVLGFGRYAALLPASYLSAYLLVYVPVRWIEWTIMARALKLTHANVTWRLGGILVSCGVDALQIALFGSLIPLGRIVC